LGHPRVLIVDDDDAVLLMLEEALKRDGCEVVAATNVRDALRAIATENFDILLSDLHMPQAGDGFTVVSAMRHTHPDALTVVLSGYPALDEAMAAIMSQADEVLTKPVSVPDLRKLMKEKLGLHEVRKVVKMEAVASILERASESTISNWLAIVEKDSELTAIPMSREARTGHLPRLLADIIIRLRLPPDSVMKPSIAARDHGLLRLAQGYSAPMVVQESRVLQVSIFSTLQDNLRSVDFSKVLLDVVTIADEVDSQLKQAIATFGVRQNAA
jgi:CheY-like chemotaxis protein